MSKEDLHSHFPRSEVLPFGPGYARISASDKLIRSIELMFSCNQSEPPSCPLLLEAESQIEAYLAGTLREFSLPFNLPPRATEFQKRVWKKVLEIPFGQTRTYGQLSRQLETSPRAVGNALRKNELPLLIPCHRVVGKYGLGGFGGTRLLKFKEFMLAHETGGLPPKDVAPLKTFQ